MSKAESENNDFIEVFPLGKSPNSPIIWTGKDGGRVMIQRLEPGDLLPHDARKVADAILAVADEIELQIMTTEAQARLEKFREALREGRAWEVLDSLERKGLRRAGRGQSLSLTQRIKLADKGLITRWGNQLTADGEQALRQLAPTGESE